MRLPDQDKKECRGTEFIKASSFKSEVSIKCT